MAKKAISTSGYRTTGTIIADKNRGKRNGLGGHAAQCSPSAGNAASLWRVCAQQRYLTSVAEDDKAQYALLFSVGD